MYDETHVVKFTEFDFTIQHPLEERLSGFLFDCNLHQRLAQDDHAPVAPGLYTVDWLDGEWAFNPLKES